MNMKLNHRAFLALAMLLALGSRHLLAAEEKFDWDGATERVDSFFGKYKSFREKNTLDLQNKDAELARLRSEFDKLNNAKAELELKIAAREDDLKSVRGQLDEQMKRQEVAEQERGHLQTALNKAESNVKSTALLWAQARDAIKSKDEQIATFQGRWTADQAQIGRMPRTEVQEVVRQVQQLKDASTILQELEKLGEPGLWSAMWQKAGIGESTAQKRINFLLKFNVTSEQFELLRELVNKIYPDLKPAPQDQAGLIGRLLDMLGEACGRIVASSFETRKEGAFDSPLMEKISSIETGRDILDSAQRREALSLIASVSEMNRHDPMVYFYQRVLDILNAPRSSIFYVQLKRAKELEEQRDTLLKLVESMLKIKQEAAVGGDKLASYEFKLDAFLTNLSQQLELLQQQSQPMPQVQQRRQESAVAAAAAAAATEQKPEGEE